MLGSLFVPPRSDPSSGQRLDIVSPESAEMICNSCFASAPSSKRGTKVGSNLHQLPQLDSSAFLRNRGCKKAYHPNISAPTQIVY